MSERWEKAHESLLSNEEPVFEELRDVEPEYTHYKHRVEALRDYEALVEDARARGELTQAEADEALWSFIDWVEQTS